MWVLYIQAQKSAVGTSEMVGAQIELMPAAQYVVVKFDLSPWMSDDNPRGSGDIREIIYVDCKIAVDYTVHVTLTTLGSLTGETITIWNWRTGELASFLNEGGIGTYHT